jgi:hypothetical protein
VASILFGRSASLSFRVVCAPRVHAVCVVHVCCPFIIFQNCSYDYSFGGSPRVRLGGSANASAGGAASAVAVDTQLTALPPRYTVNTTAAVTVAAVINGVASFPSASSGNMTVEVRLNGGTWTDVRALVSSYSNDTHVLSLSGLEDGQQVLQARGRLSEESPDQSPWSYLWTVDSTPPHVTFWRAPPALSTQPACSAAFVIVPDEDLCTVQAQWRMVNASAGDDGSVNASAWQTLPDTQFVVQGLAAAPCARRQRRCLLR